MRYRALLSAVALCFLVAGCESKKEEPVKPKVADKVVPVPAPAPTPPPASGAQDARPAQMADVPKTGVAPPAPARKPACKGGQHCTVTLTVTGTADPNCTISKSDKTLYVARGNAPGNSPETIKWVATGGWQFDTNGIDFAGNPLFTCNGAGAQYQCVDQNPEKQPTPHSYTIKLKNGANKCTKDPTIVNGSDEENQVQIQ